MLLRVLKTGNIDDGCGNVKSSISWLSTAGKTYHIQVTGNSPDEDISMGSYVLQVTGARPGQTLVERNAPGKHGKSCHVFSRMKSSLAHSFLAACTAGPFTTVTGDTTNAPAPSTNPQCLSETNDDCVNGCASLWYTIIGTGGTITATTCSAGTDFDTRLVLYRGSCASLTCVAHNDDGCNTAGSSLSWNSEAGVNYSLQVTGYGSADVGAFTLHVDGTDAALVQTQGTTECTRFRNAT